MNLTIELVPKSCWFSNLRSCISKADWGRLKKIVSSKAKNTCEICQGVGSKWPVECHERGHYDDERKVQSLLGLMALCPFCHLVKHMGYANISGKRGFAQSHLAKINQWSMEKTEAYIKEQFQLWEERSQYEWTLNLNWLERCDVAIALPERLGQKEGVRNPFIRKECSRVFSN